MWAIITGIDAEHAIKSIDNDSVTQPFIIQRAINFTNVDQNLFERCFTFSDGKKGCWYGKKCGLDDGSGEEKDEGEEFLKPPAQIFSDKFNEIEPDLLVTSGHGSEQSVDMPWSAGKLEVKENGLVPLDENSKPIAPIIETSSNPKIFLPIANCLVGHCTGPQCMVTTFLGRLGVRQMCGYTVRTWYGRAGWGTLDLWKSVPGRLTLADAYFLHQVRMTYDLKSINPRLLDFKFDLSDDNPGYETIVEQLDKQYHLDNDNIDDNVLQDIYGLCYDHDTFVFYGDPAFIAILDENKTEKILTTKFLRTGKTTHQFIIEYKDIESAQNFHLPIGNLFTNRIKNYNIINGFEYSPILSDNFLILLKPIPRDKETKIIKIDFRGTIIQ
jgi:zinc protease